MGSFSSVYECQNGSPFDEIADWGSEEVEGELDFTEEWAVIAVSTVMWVPEVSVGVEASFAETGVDLNGSVLPETWIWAVGFNIKHYQKQITGIF